MTLLLTLKEFADREHCSYGRLRNVLGHRSRYPKVRHPIAYGRKDGEYAYRNPDLIVFKKDIEAQMNKAPKVTTIIKESKASLIARVSKLENAVAELKQTLHKLSPENFSLEG